MRLQYLLPAALAVAFSLSAQDVPSPWSDASIAGYRLPLAGLGRAPKMVSGAAYYALPEVNLKTYPVYTPDKEPKGYLEWLQSKDPEPMVDVSKLHTREDWIAAGREVFYGRELPALQRQRRQSQADSRSRGFSKPINSRPPKTACCLGCATWCGKKARWNSEPTRARCAMSAFKPDGSVIEGPANVHTPFGPLMGDLTRRYAGFGAQYLEERRRRQMREDYRVPFLHPDPNLASADLPAEEIARLYDENPLGVHPRTNTSLLYPVKIANLIGIGDMKFFDRTGTSRNRSIADLMRYSGSIADVSDALTEYGDGPDGKINLANMGLKTGIHRTPDALLYALALFVESLRPPPNPNHASAESERGQAVFQTQGCANCHTPPFYTNNRLTLALGYHPSDSIMRLTGAMNISVGTDPNLALKTRKGTGFYRVPSLRMVWMEAALLHDGSIGSLEEMFNPARLQPDFRSSNWAPITKPHAVEGHPFGLKLAPADRAALIAFLRTL